MSANVSEIWAGDGTRLDIRLMRPEDVPAVAQIYNEAIARSESTNEFEPRTREQCGDWILTGDERFSGYVAERDDQVVGWGALTRLYPRAAYDATAELSVYVSAGQRRGGIGRALSAHIVDRARALDHHLLIAFVFAHPEWLVDAVRRRGFDHCGTLPEAGIWRATLRDVMMFALRLDGRPPEPAR